MVSVVENKLTQKKFVEFIAFAS